MEKEHLYIVLTRTNTVISRLIHFFTQDDYTHAAIAFDRELNEMYSFARKGTYNPFIGRFKRECLSEGIYRISKELPGIILEIQVSHESYKEARAIIERFLQNRTLYKYNYRGLIYGLLNKPTTNEYRFLCSQFVYYILHETGVADFEIPANLVRPQDFLELDGHVLFKGDLKTLTEERPRLPIRLRLANWYREKGLPYRRAS